MRTTHETTRCVSISPPRLAYLPRRHAAANSRCDVPGARAGVHDSRVDGALPAPPTKRGPRSRDRDRPHALRGYRQRRPYRRYRACRGGHPSRPRRSLNDLSGPSSYATNGDVTEAAGSASDNGSGRVSFRLLLVPRRNVARTAPTALLRPPGRDRRSAALGAVARRDGRGQGAGRDLPDRRRAPTARQTQR